VDEYVHQALAPLFDLLFELVHVAHDFEQRPTALLDPAEVDLEPLHVLPQAGLGREETFDARLLRRPSLGVVRELGGGHAWFLSAFIRSFCWRRDSTSFSKAIILSSRPTTTSSNFSRSRIFSFSSP